MQNQLQNPPVADARKLSPREELALGEQKKLLLSGLNSTQVRTTMMIRCCEEMLQHELTEAFTGDDGIELMMELNRTKLKFRQLEELMARVSAVETNKLLAKRERSTPESLRTAG